MYYYLCFCNYCNKPYDFSSQGRLVSCKTLSQRLESVSDLFFLLQQDKIFGTALGQKDQKVFMLVGHGFGDVYLLCLLQHYLNDKAIF